MYTLWQLRGENLQYAYCVRRVRLQWLLLFSYSLQFLSSFYKVLVSEFYIIFELLMSAIRLCCA